MILFFLSDCRMKDLSVLMKKRFRYQDVMDANDDYASLGEQLEQLVQSGRIRPVKNAGRVAFRPFFFREYYLNDTISETIVDSSRLHALAPVLLEYYISHAEHYVEDEAVLVSLSDWMKSDGEKEECSVKERSFEIYRDEKMLEGMDAQRVLKRCGLTYRDLNCYRTYEPFFLERISDHGCALILENKDPWVSIAKAMKQKQTSLFLHEPVMYLIYGEGNKVTKDAPSARLQDFISGLDPKPDRILYCGDIDKAGVSILTRCQKANPELEILPFGALYEAMMERAPFDPLDNEPVQDHKTKTYDRSFADLFERRDYVRTVLDHDRRIPQEILGLPDYRKMSGE